MGSRSIPGCRRTPFGSFDGASSLQRWFHQRWFHRTIHTQIYGNLGYFPWKCTNLSGKIWVAADSQRRRNNALFPRSEAKGKLVLFRSQQRRLRLVLLQQRGNSSVICRALSRQFHIWIDQQRGNMLVFSLCSRWFCGFRLKSKNGTVRRAGPLGGFYTIGLG